jgi:hypothetical protein
MRIPGTPHDTAISVRRNQMKRAALLGICCLIQPMVFGGCETMAKQGFKEFKGAGGEYVQVQDLQENSLSKFKDVKLVDVRNDIGKVCPNDLVTRMKAAFVKTKSEMQDQYPGGAPALHVDLTITYLQDSGGAGTLLGGLGFMIVRGKFKDDAGNLVSDALFVADSEAMRTGEGELADAIIQALGKYLKEFKGKSDEG